MKHIGFFVLKKIMIKYDSMIGNIIPEIRTGKENEIYSYIIPEKLKSQVKVGSFVVIPFGKKKIRGIVKELRAKSQEFREKYELKEIISIDENFSLPEKYLEIIKWISEYYLCSQGEAASLFLPPNIKRPQTNAHLVGGHWSPQQIKLTSEQEGIFQKIKQLLNAKAKKPVLLHGVTGSGKTEIYIKLIEETIESGKQVIFLVPEIMLATHLIERLNKSLSGKINILHSGLSKSERFTAYREFFNGEKPVIFGPRSALLVPSNNIGLIIIDEEHEDAYKQESNPRYHAVELAKKIAESQDGLVVMGSATPRIESFYKAKLGKYHLFELKNRYLSLILPTSKIIDLKEELKAENYSPISTFLRNKIKETLKNKKQVLLLLNRLGMATFVSCRECAAIIMCPNCNIPLVYHLGMKNHFLSCHHCDHKEAVPAVCPDCKGSKIKFFGTGIEKVEIEIKKLFPVAKVKKIDSKILSTKGGYRTIFNELADKKIDILIGTQIIAKGLDLPSVDLVGVISADIGLHLPHYRAGEKTFELLTQVSGRSGRKHNSGFTVIQSYWPESKPIIDASTHNYADFYNFEILERKKYSYPPFKSLIRIISMNINNGKAKEEIAKAAKMLSEQNIQFIGPGECFFNKLNRRYRYHLIIKIDKIPNPKIKEVFKANQYLTWDTDPINLL